MCFDLRLTVLGFLSIFGMFSFQEWDDSLF